MQTSRLDSVSDFKDQARNTSSVLLRKHMESLCQTAKDLSDAESQTDGFEKLFGRFLEQQSAPALDWSKIKPPPDGMVTLYKKLSTMPASRAVELLDKLVVVKLNGGLGTTMGCTGPKSVIEVRDDMTFLDITVRQIEWLNESFGVSVPLILMNSFNTHSDTERIIRKYAHSSVEILTFNQSRYPRIYKETLLPVAVSWDSNDAEWYPPGHGDVYQALYNSGYLDGLIETKGKDIMFMSNIDNLGATVDVNILQHFADAKDCEFIMEVTDKTLADVKGGTLINYEGQCRLLEIAQVPSAYQEDFKSIKKFKIFNTNNIWMKLKAIKRVVTENDAGMDLEVIVNEKSHMGSKIYQLETAVGAGIRHFRGSCGINVPRSRFLPVKTCSDLLLLKSNLYSLEHGNLKINPLRPIPDVPLVKLGKDNFQKVHDFMARFKSMPDIVELSHLTVSGDVNFGKNVILKGTVIIIANLGSHIDIPDGAELENKIISGNLRILEH